MKKNILIYALKGTGWIGGVYYIKNLLYQLSVSPEAAYKYKYYIYADQVAEEEFEEFIEIMHMHVVTPDGSREQILAVCDDYDIDVVLPVIGGGYTWLIRDICLYWIPDFQEIHFPENFTLESIEDRRITRGYIAKEHKSLILSSQDSYRDYRMQYPENTENVFVVHFVSYISHLIEQMTETYESNILQKNKIAYDYIFVANQFWRHKNHVVLLRAMDELVNRRGREIHLVCTGFMQSYGQRDAYVESLYQYIEEHRLQNYIHFLGLLERKEQLCLMKNARLLIQPSKFEGWGCSVEDAKVMGKNMLLSDIGVHREQQYAKSILFPQDDSSVLAKLIMENFESAEKYDLTYGSRYTMEKARQYSLELQNAIDAMGVKESGDYLKKLNKCRKEKVLQLFGGLPSDQICIWGVGWQTEQILKICRQIWSDISFVYSDADETKWGTDFNQGKVYPPSQLSELGIRRIIICDTENQEIVYQSIKAFEKDVEIVGLYHSDREKNEPLWMRENSVMK